MFALAVGSVVAAAWAQRPDTIESALADYRQWTRLTKEAVNISPFVLAMCRMPSKEETALVQSDHKNRFIHVYVNTTGAAAMRQTGKRQFPAGSVIVKEKLANKSDVAPEALGIMIKRSAADWEFAYQEKGKISRGSDTARCAACHAAQTERDMVFYPQPFPVTP